MAEIQRQSTNLAKECDDSDKAKLQEVMDGEFAEMLLDLCELNLIG
jgi:hypothetical protein